jgi:protein O-mannosyl-transferase
VGVSKRQRNLAKPAEHAPSAQVAPVAPSLNISLDIWICVLLLLATLAVYAQVRDHAFLNIDDPAYVTLNKHVSAGFTRDSIAWAFTSTADANWFPLTWLSLMLDAQLFGLSPASFHLTSVFVHILSTLLLFIFLKCATNARWPSAFVAFLFALHPLHVESVAWVAERKDVLSGFFFFSTLCAYLLYARRPGPLRYSLVFLLLCLGLMSKPMLVTLPFVLLLLDFWPLNRARSDARFPLSLIVEKLPLFALSVISSWVTWFAQSNGGAVAPFDKYPFGLRLENAIVAYAVYIAKTLWPSNLAVLYPYPALPLWQVAFGALILAALSLAALLAWRRRPYLAVGWLWYLGTLVPVIGLVQVGSQSRADRYMYLPLVGLAIMLAWTLDDLVRHRPQVKRTVAALAAIACTACLTLTWLQIQNWKDSETILLQALAVTHDNAFAHINLAQLYLDQGRFQEALSHSQTAVRLVPDSAEAHMNLAGAFGNTGNPAASEEHYRQALRLQPKSLNAHSWLGVALMQQGRTAESLREEQIAVQLAPESSIARDNLGRLLVSLGRIDEAIPQYTEAVRLEPDDPELHCHFGIALGNAQKIDEAIREFNEALQLKPAYADAHFNLAIALAQQGALDAAIGHFNEVLRLDPAFPGAEQGLKDTLALKNGGAK